MKKTIQILILTLILSTSVYSQSTERFIRIIGNAKKEISADKAKVQITISEQKANKYNENSKDISFEEAYNSTITELSKIGIKESELEIVIQGKSYSRGNSKNYYVITDFDKLENISNIQVDGMRIKEIKYLFDMSDEDLETELSLKAINDAKRKAKAICDEINMKVGKILNIEVKESSYGTEKIENKKEDIIKSYRVAITFKLVD
ncbi:SIMPL domain-containing protein [Algibacter luteus]|uniref:SIMPL domain-containing protein n=1 Tax=Algibacter luteus TaxID=1178825 RepID=UPI00259303A3|nr:SIMPL domain-containing protein [Algibacter luteus]WJJ95584.1 SIMPL domain-containing protein [Algibacter luteus]